MIGWESGDEGESVMVPRERGFSTAQAPGAVVSGWCFMYLVGSCEVFEFHRGKQGDGYVPGPVVPMGISITAASV